MSILLAIAGFFGTLFKGAAAPIGGLFAAIIGSKITWIIVATLVTACAFFLYIGDLKDQNAKLTAQKLSLQQEVKDAQGVIAAQQLNLTLSKLNSDRMAAQKDELITTLSEQAAEDQTANDKLNQTISEISHATDGTACAASAPIAAALDSLRH